MIKTINEYLLREKIIKLALLQHKKPYSHEYIVPFSFDCTALVYYVYKEVLDINILEGGVGISTTTKLMTSSFGVLNYYTEGKEVHDLSSLKRGDILFFHRQSMDQFEPREDNKYPGHCAIYLGDNRFIHATSYYGHVAINNFETSKVWPRKLVASKDIISYYES